MLIMYDVERGGVGLITLHITKWIGVVGLTFNAKWT